MTPEQALQVLSQLVNKMALTREDWKIVDQAFDVLILTIHPQSKPVAEVPKGK
jgi:hypothetical protein